jgi:hypothetical protein
MMHGQKTIKLRIATSIYLTRLTYLYQDFWRTNNRNITTNVVGMAYKHLHVQIVESDIWDKLVEPLGPDLKNIFSLINIKMKIPNSRNIIERVIIHLGP